MALCDHGCFFSMRRLGRSSGTITALRAQKHRPDRVSVYLDGDFGFGLALVEAVRLKVGQVLSREAVDALLARDSTEDAYERALRILSYRPRSAREVRDALARSRTPPEVIDGVIERLERAGLLDDAEFTKFWVRDRETFRPRSRFALRMELRTKGVDEATIAGALEDVDEAASALEAARHQARRMTVVDSLALRERLISFLARRGFAYAVAGEAVKQVLAERATADQPDDESEER